jgi:hypothetical protein
MGSCFSDEMGKQFKIHGFNSIDNPMGIAFNPISIEKHIYHIVNQVSLPPETFVERDKKICSYDIHSRISGVSVKDFEDKINGITSQSYEFLRSTQVAFITLGSAWVYVLKETGQIVANCHKKPQNNFTKRLLNIDEIKGSLANIISHLKQINSNLKIVFTVSPVRHIKDGFWENNVSKGALQIAIWETIDCVESFYFPSYELLIDDLRDYRFFADDMLHPSTQGVEYVWEKLKQSMICETANLPMINALKNYKRKSHIGD